ncbi:hypothetical protein N665_0076s0297 [Sinapis alba]|nr:hypothetical protein N665_0076s0297 [Sinapis alba]
MVNDYVSSVLKSLLLLLQLVLLSQHHAGFASIVKFLPGYDGLFLLSSKLGLFCFLVVVINSEFWRYLSTITLFLVNEVTLVLITDSLRPCYTGQQQAYVLGNPKTEPEIDFNYRIPFAHGMALISDELYESLKRVCQGKYMNVEPCNTKCLKLLKNIIRLVLQIYRYLLATYWANDKSVRKALQINKSIGEWVRCNRSIPYTKDIISSVPYHMNNSISGYRSLIFSGDHDMEVPYLGTQAWIRSLNYSIVDDWRPWMINDQIAGEVGTQQSLNQRKALSCFKDGSMANLCKIGEWLFKSYSENLSKSYDVIHISLRMSLPLINLLDIVVCLFTVYEEDVSLTILKLEYDNINNYFMLRNKKKKNLFICSRQVRGQ